MKTYIEKPLEDKKKMFFPFLTTVTTFKCV